MDWAIYYRQRKRENPLLHNFIQLIEALKGNPLSLPVFVVLYAAACFVIPVSLFPVAGGVLFGFRAGIVINLATVLLGPRVLFSSHGGWANTRSRVFLAAGTTATRRRAYAIRARGV